MTELYTARRRKYEAREKSRQGIVWIILCVFLVACLGGLWTHAQSLAAQNATLRNQLAAAKPAKADHDTTCRVDDAWQPNTVSTHHVDGRQYLVHTPTDFKRDQYYPLLFSFPGKSADVQQARELTGLDPLPAIVVYPYPTVGTDGYTAWQGAPYSSPANDVAFTEAIIEKTQGDLCIDRTRIYAIGVSNGGGFVSLLSCKLNERFAAYAIVAGAMYEPDGNCVPPRPTPLINTHGDVDPNVPYLGSISRHLPSIEAWTAKRAELNGCSKHLTTNTGFSLAVTTYSGCRDDATVEGVRVIGGGHGMGDVTPQMLWQFLSRFSL